MTEQPTKETAPKPTLAPLSDSDKKDIMKMAAVGLNPEQIAASLDMTRMQRLIFVAAAETPGTMVAELLEKGRAVGVSGPLVKLQEAAVAGNIDAVKTLRDTRRENQFFQLLNAMDDDEFTIQNITD